MSVDACQSNARRKSPTVGTPSTFNPVEDPRFRSQTNICIIASRFTRVMESLKRKHVVFDEDAAEQGPTDPSGAAVHPDRAAVVAAAEGAAVKKAKVSCLKMSCN